MKRIAILLMAMAATLSCAPKNESPALIEKHDVEVVNGQFTPEIMHQLGKVSDPQYCAETGKILYGVTYTSIELNKGNRELFVMNADGTGNHQITRSAGSKSNARWIDGGKRIAYLQKGQLWVADADGKNARQVSDVEGGIGEFKLSPDGTKALYTSDFKVAPTAADLYPDIPKSTARTITGMMYRHWDHFVETIPHTYLADFDGEKLGEGRDLLDGAPFELPTEPFSGIEQLDFSPDGSKIAYSCRKLTGREYAFSTNTDIYLYDIATGSCENLTEGMPGYDTDPLFSPDGSKIAWISMARDGYEADKERLFVLDLATRTKTELTTAFKYNAGGLCWNAASTGLWFTSSMEGLKEICFADLATASCHKLTQGDWVDFSALSLMGEDRLLATNCSMMRPSEIVSVSTADGSWKQLTQENDDILAQLAPVTMEQRWIRTTDGKKMLTWVVYPPKFNPTNVYPAVLICLGGPQGAITQGWSTRWNYRLMASQGYIIVLPNRRGTTAFGQEWCEQISGDYIGQNMKDYLSAADALLAEPYVGKMCAAGASYGGYSVYYLAGIHKNRFSALIAHAGIFNQEHMFMETEEMWFPNWDNGGCKDPKTYMAGSPWSKTPAAVRHYANSAHKLAKNWNTPILVMHGELDYRVPVDQGMAAFNTAQMMGVPSKMVLFPDENHWILKPQNSVHWHREFFAWVDKWCK